MAIGKDRLHSTIRIHAFLPGYFTSSKVSGYVALNPTCHSLRCQPPQKAAARPITKPTTAFSNPSRPRFGFLRGQHHHPQPDEICKILICKCTFCGYYMTDVGAPMAKSSAVVQIGGFGSTLRRDAWWVEIVPVVLLLGGFGVYATCRAFEGKFYAW